MEIHHFSHSGQGEQCFNREFASKSGAAAQPMAQTIHPASYDQNYGPNRLLSSAQILAQATTQNVAQQNVSTG